MAFGPALSLGFGSLGEFMDVDLTEARAADAVMAALNRELPDGITVVEAEALPPSTRPVDRSLWSFSYAVSLRNLPPGRISEAAVSEGVARWAAAASFPLPKRVKGVLRQIDARLLVSIARTGPRELLVETRITPAGTVKPHHVVGALFDLSERETRLLQVLKLGTTLVPEAPPAGARADDARAGAS
jgi:radical SAM-linked protein